jgi:tetratricopeptide (TPR) repeat protein
VNQSESAIVARYRKQLYTLEEEEEPASPKKGAAAAGLKQIHTVEGVEKHLATKRRWQIVRESLRAYARESLRSTLIEGLLTFKGIERECGDDLVLALGQLGFNCASETSGANDTTTMAVGATLLLAKAHDYDYVNVVARKSPLDADIVAKTEARIFRARAMAHWRVFDKQGQGSGKGELSHLEACVTNWETALKHMAVAGDPKSWVAFAAANTCKGAYEVAANAYGTVLRSFHAGNDSNVALSCASLLKALGSYDQAIAYMFSALSMGLSPPYDNIDITFLMARLHEEQGVFARETAVEAKRKAQARKERRTRETQEREARKSRKERRSQGALDDDLKGILERTAKKTRESTAFAGMDMDEIKKEALADEEANKDKEEREEEDEEDEEDEEPDSTRIARNAYKAVFKTMKDLDDESSDDYDTVEQWLADYKTWDSHGDRCASAGHHILASDLYEQALLRIGDAEHSDKPRLYLKLAKGFRRCGQVERASSALRSAMDNTHDSAKKDKLNLLLKAWMSSSETADAGNRRRKQRQTFNADGNVLWKISLMLSIPDILEKFVPKPAERTEDLELARIRATRELKQKNGKWRFLRRRLKEAARKEFAKIFVESVHDADPKSKTRKILKGTLKDDEISELNEATAQGGYASPTRRLSSLNAMQLAARDEVTVSLSMLVTMGKLCHDSSSSSQNLHRCAAVLLQRAVDSGYIGDGEFYRKLARSHFRAYTSAGASGEREHLALSNVAWDKAFEHLDNASKVDCWLDASQVRIHAGDFERAAQTLGVLVRSFPKFEGLAAVSLTASSILQQLGNFDQAKAYMCVQSERPRRANNILLCAR